MAAFARSAGVRLRPHAKTHKCPTVALKQIAAGAVGQCCQKVGEAEALVRGGVRDVLVSNEVVDAQKLRRLAALATEATVALCFDAAEQVERRVARGDRVWRRNRRARRNRGRDAALRRRCPANPPRRSRAGSPMHRDCAFAACRRITAPPSTCRPLPTASVRSPRRPRRCARRSTALQEAGLACEFISGAGTGTYRIEGTQRPVERVAGGVVSVHGYRLRQDRRQGRRPLHRFQAQPVRAVDGDQRADRRPRDRRRRAQVVQRRERSALGAWPRRYSGHGRVRRARQAPARTAGAAPRASATR